MNVINLALGTLNKSNYKFDSLYINDKLGTGLHGLLHTQICYNIMTVFINLYISCTFLLIWEAVFGWTLKRCVYYTITI